MKRFILLLSSIGLIGFSYGQNHQIEVGAGLLSTNTFVDIFSSIGKNIGNSFFDGTKLENGKQYGEFRASYSYAPLNWLSVGATFSYAKSMHDHVKNDVVVGSESVDYFTLGAEATFYYMKKKNIRLYGLLGAGATLMNQKERTNDDSQEQQKDFTYFNFQVSPFGIEAGAEDFGGFFEVGFGYRGMASIGAFYRL